MKSTSTKNMNTNHEYEQSINIISDNLYSSAVDDASNKSTAVLDKSGSWLRMIRTTYRWEK